MSEATTIEPTLPMAEPTIEAEPNNPEDFVFEGEDQATEQVQTEPKPMRETVFEIDGKEYKATEEQLRKYYGFKPEDEITDREWKTIVSSYKQGIQFNNKNREAQRMRKTLEDMANRLYTDPESTLRDLYKDNPQKLRELSEAILLKELEEEMLDPKEKEDRRVRQELEEYKRLIAEQEKAKEQAQLDAMTEHYSNQITTEIIDVLENSGLPKNEKTVGRFAFYLHRGAQRGYDLTVKDVLPLVKEDIESEIQSIVRSSDPSQLINLLGEDILKQIRQEDLKRVKGSMIEQRSQVGQPVQKSPTQRNQRQTLTPDQFRELARERIKNLR